MQASAVVVHRFIRPVICGIIPDQISNPSPALASGFLTTGPPRKSYLFLCIKEKVRFS